MGGDVPCLLESAQPRVADFFRRPMTRVSSIVDQHQHQSLFYFFCVSPRSAFPTTSGTKSGQDDTSMINLGETCGFLWGTQVNVV